MIYLHHLRVLLPVRVLFDLEETKAVLCRDPNPNPAASMIFLRSTIATASEMEMETLARSVPLI
jgi:hypothetical protein